MPLVLDLRIANDRFGSRCDPNINGHSHYPNDLDGSLNEVATDKISIVLTIIIVPLTVSMCVFYCHLKTYCGPSSETIQSPDSKP